MYSARRNNERSGVPNAQAGFSLLEVVAIVLIFALAVPLTGSLLTSDRTGISVRADVEKVAVRLRQARLSAIRERSIISAFIDTERRLVTASDGRGSIRLDPRYRLNVIAAQSARHGNGDAGVRFYSNGGSSGATLEFLYGSSRHELRVNWLTGRIRTRQIH